MIYIIYEHTIIETEENEIKKLTKYIIFIKKKIAGLFYMIYVMRANNIFNTV